MSRTSALVILLTIFAGTGARADDLTVYIYPAPITIDWQTPAGLAWSTVENELFDDNDQLIAIHDIGHMNFDLNCGVSAENPNPVRYFTGQTNTDDSQMYVNLLDKDYGIGVMLTQYTGAWENQSDIEHDLPIRYSSGAVAYIHMTINPTTCARVAAYLQEYQQHGYDKIYGGLQDLPRKQQGAGCSAFAEGVLEIAGVMAPEWKSYWSHSVNIPDSLIGGPITGNDVSMVDLLLGSLGQSWAKSATNAYPVTFWDPYYAWWWVQYAVKSPTALTGMSYTPSKRGNANGVEIDATAVATPTDNFWIP